MKKTKILLVPNPDAAEGELPYVEDDKGYVPGLRVEYDNGGKIIVVCPMSEAHSYEGRIAHYNLKEFHYMQSTSKWVYIPGGSGYFAGDRLEIKEDYYVDKNTGELESDPYIEDAEHPHGRWLKENVISRYEFWLRKIGRRFVFPDIQAEIEKRFVQ